MSRFTTTKTTLDGNAYEPAEMLASTKDTKKQYSKMKRQQWRSMLVVEENNRPTEYYTILKENTNRN